MQKLFCISLNISHQMLTYYVPEMTEPRAPPLTFRLRGRTCRWGAVVQGAKEDGRRPGERSTFPAGEGGR